MPIFKQLHFSWNSASVDAAWSDREKKIENKNKKRKFLNFDLEKWQIYVRLLFWFFN